MKTTLKSLVILCCLAMPLWANQTYICRIYSIITITGETKIMDKRAEFVKVVEYEDGSLWIEGPLFSMITSQDQQRYTKIYNNFKDGIHYLSENYLIEMVACERIDEKI